MTTLEAVLAFIDGTPETQLSSVVDKAVRCIRAEGGEVQAIRELAGAKNSGRAWLRAALLDAIGSAECESAYQLVTSASGLEIPDVLLRLARFAERAGDRVRGATLLCRALRMHPGYPLIVRAETLAKKCRPAIPVRRCTRVALIGSCTTALFRSVLDLMLIRDGIEATFYEAPFATYRQEILDENSGLYRFKPEFIVPLLKFEDAGLSQPFCEFGSGDSAVAEMIGYWERLLSGTSARVLQPCFNLPAVDSNLALSSLLPGGITRTIKEINSKLFAAAPSRVTLLDTPRIACTAKTWEDAAQWSSGKLYPGTDAYPILAEHVVSGIRASLGLSSKLLVLDLDNTLWGGVIGEDGLEGIKLGPPSALGERYQMFHRYLQGLKARGVPLAVVSKNNQEDAASVFTKHDSCVLRLDDFVGFRANWEDKASNLRALSEELSLGLDSFVFLDDNPVERATVRSSLPDVAVPEISGEPTESISALERGLYFQAIHFTDEDRARSASYTGRASAGIVSRRAENVDEYLLQLDTRIRTGMVDSASLPRVAQLVNKTNQFNLTSRRYTEHELAAKIECGDSWFRWFRVEDRFADHGLTGVILANMDCGFWTVDLWLMSCRVIGRRFEDFMFNQLLSAAQEAGASLVKARYIPSAKNGVVRDLLPSYGFNRTSDDEYELIVATAIAKQCLHLKAA